MKQRLISFASIAALAMGAAQAAPVTGGSTAIDLNTGLPLTFTVLSGGTGTTWADGGLEVTFDVTGGDVDQASLVGTIEHDGATLLVSDGMNSITLSNFVIDTGAETVFADIGSEFGDLPGAAVLSFDLGQSGFDPFTDLMDLDDPALDLVFSDAAQAILLPIFGPLASTAFGEAASMITFAGDDITAEVPLPAGALLFGTAIAGYAARRKTKAQHAS
jgi:hypothetical protein